MTLIIMPIFHLKKYVQMFCNYELHLIYIYVNIFIWDSTQKVSPCWQAVDCGHHPLICNHKASALVFHGLPLWHLYGGHVGSRVWCCLSAANYTLTWNDRNRNRRSRSGCLHPENIGEGTLNTHCNYTADK